MSSDGISRARAQFGPTADAYATSDVHAKGESLGLLVDMLAPEGGALLDVATGAGHTAIALAPHVDRVIATDVTQEMLAKTTKLAESRGYRNIETVSAAAEALPFDDEAFDTVTCRLAFHHFEDRSAAAAEMARVTRRGGKLGLTDNVTTQDESAAEYYNAYEKLRDPSHSRVLSLSSLIAVFEGAGFVVTAARRLSKEFEFNEWADRQRVSAEGKKALLSMMRRIPPALEPLLAPRWADDSMYFSLWEAVLVGFRVS